MKRFFYRERSCEDPSVWYLNLFGRRFTFRTKLKKPCSGWYKP